MEKLERTKCERYSRIVGYLRPLQQWNDGKKAEWDNRIMFKVMAENVNKRIAKNDAD